MGNTGSNMGTWSVSRRIYSSFFITLTFIFILALVSLFAGWMSSQYFTNYKETAKQKLFVDRALKDLSEARLVAMGYPEVSEEALTGSRRVIHEIVEDKAALTDLFNGEGEDEWLTQLQGLAVVADSYVDMFDELIELHSQRDQLVVAREKRKQQKLDVIGAQLQDGYENIANELLEQQNTIDRIGSKRIDYLLYLVGSVALISFLIVIFLSNRLSSSITNSVKSLANNINELANGNLNVRINGADQPHELGTIAKSLTIFRDNAQKLDELVLDKKNNNLAIEKEHTKLVKQTATIADLQASLSSVVSTAVAGDFTGRVETDLSEDVLRDLAQRINTLLETTEKGLDDVLRVLASMSKGDLTTRIEADYEGVFNQLKVNVNKTNDQLTEVVSKIQDTALSVKAGSNEIAQGNVNLNQRTEEQALSLEETAFGMQEMTNTVRQNAVSAVQANQLAMDAREQAEKGGSVVSEAVKAMGEINASSRKISDIIGVIDEIAFQTNLLALNASVEAARAGDQGRGFSVVASEVRNLAGRSAKAAKEIKILIEDSGTKVEDGSRLVNESGQVLSEIVSGVKKVSDIVGEIAAASQEQSIGLDEVNTKISQLDQLTHQNASLVENAASASDSLGKQSADLGQLMSFFTINGEISKSTRAIVSSVNTSSRKSDKKPSNPVDTGSSNKVVKMSNSTQKAEKTTDHPSNVKAKKNLIEIDKYAKKNDKKADSQVDHNVKKTPVKTVESTFKSNEKVDSPAKSNADVALIEKTSLPPQSAAVGDDQEWEEF